MLADMNLGLLRLVLMLPLELFLNNRLNDPEIPCYPALGTGHLKSRYLYRSVCVILQLQSS
jgi:hypothetical protein